MRSRNVPSRKLIYSRRPRAPYVCPTRRNLLRALSIQHLALASQIAQYKNRTTLIVSTHRNATQMEKNVWTRLQQQLPVTTQLLTRYMLVAKKIQLAPYTLYVNNEISRVNGTLARTWWAGRDLSFYAATCSLARRELSVGTTAAQPHRH